MTRSRTVRIGLAVALITLLHISTPNPATARKQYFDSFVRQYPILAGRAKAAKCGVCHGPKSKKDRSDYAELLAQELGVKNVKNNNAIDAALDEVAKKKLNGMTYQARFDAGLLPPAFPN